MSTRSRIGIESSACTLPLRVTSIYCHFDGHPEGVGATLAAHWTESADIVALLALGDISVLGSELGEEHPFESHDHGGRWTLAYGRDRKEKGVEAKSHPANDWPDSGQEYEYLFAQITPNDPSRGWFVRETPYGRERGPWRRLGAGGARGGWRYGVGVARFGGKSTPESEPALASEQLALMRLAYRLGALDAVRPTADRLALSGCADEEERITLLLSVFSNWSEAFEGLREVEPVSA